MAMDNQAFAIALCFLSLYCIVHSPTAECISSEEKYYTVGIDTFQIEEESGLNAVRRQVEVVAPQDSGKGDADLVLTHRNPDSGLSWRNLLLKGLERDTHVVNGSLRRREFNVPIKSGRETDGPEYVVTSVIGTPGREQLLGIDTFSPLSWVQCFPCNGCSSRVNYPMYVPSNSSTFKPVRCSSSKCPPLGANPRDISSRCNKLGFCSYADTKGLVEGSQGVYITDTLRLGSNTFEGFYLACAKSFTQARTDRTSGRLGLGRGTLSLVSQKYGGQFSYCLPNYLSLRATGSLRLGKGSIPSSIKSFIPMQRVAGFFPNAYIVSVQDISVGGERLNVKMQAPGGLPIITYIDASVMVSRFVQHVFDALKYSFEQKMKKIAPGVLAAKPLEEFSPCYQLTSLNSVRIPTITLHFAGKVYLDVPVVGTLLQVDSNRVCFPFLPSNYAAVNIIGNVQQQGLRVAFDNPNNKIGFIPESC
ncbi:hypothetical protein KI387_033171 [Taxus chinensis]|uniref:Peptidase A1 domain-containing protein n=1 Tax=Taxus chinensis TaxID=29808 RepID=A0AA38C320_TAXCH|nr:hypothetical protein KI387_033171 [Taxus chinensis]